MKCLISKHVTDMLQRKQTTTMHCCWSSRALISPNILQQKWQHTNICLRSIIQQMLQNQQQWT